MPLLNAILFQRKMKIPPPVLLPRLAVHLQNFKKTYFIICSDKRMSESNIYSEGGMGRFKIGCVKDHLIE